MTIQYRIPELLNSSHEIAGFECRSVEQTNWFKKFARQSHAADSTKVLVVTTKDSPEVVAYYAWRMSEVHISDLPDRMQKGQGKYPQPAALLARLGVDIKHEGKGIGAALVRDVILRMVNIGDQVGCRGLLIHCETQEARNFYRRLLPKIMESPTDPFHLVLLRKDVQALLTEGHK